MAHHKRRRPKFQRAGCICGSKEAKRLSQSPLRSRGLGWTVGAAARRLRLRAEEI